MYDCSGLVSTPSIQQPKDMKINTITLPYQLPGTELIIRNFVAYEGVEDASEILAVVLENTGNEWIVSCDVQIFEKDACFTFTATFLPTNSLTLAIESDRSRYENLEIQRCAGQVCYLSKNQGAETDVVVAPVDMGSICIINRSQNRYDSLCVYYKSFDPISGLYINGLAFQEAVYDLLPEEKRVVFPAHYAGKYSQILIIMAE